MRIRSAVPCIGIISRTQRWGTVKRDRKGERRAWLACFGPGLEISWGDGGLMTMVMCGQGIGWQLSVSRRTAPAHFSRAATPFVPQGVPPGRLYLRLIDVLPRRLPTDRLRPRPAIGTVRALRLDRPCPAAEGVSVADPSAWASADARFERTTATEGRWVAAGELPDRWAIGHGPIVLELKRTEFGHLGVFPEQAAHWDWIVAQAAPPRNR